MEHAGGLEFRPGDRPDTWVLRLDGMDQSHVNLADPTRIAFPYVRRIADVLDAVAPPGEPVRVVHVGGAGLTLPRYVAATRPRSAQVVLEPDAVLTARVRDDLPLPPRSGIRVRDVDGRSGLAALRDAHADVLVLDAFADARVPGDLVTREAWTQAARVVGPAGVVVANLVDRAPFAWTRRALAGAREVLPELALGAETATLRARRPGNLVVVASTRPVPVASLRRAAGSASAYRVLDGDGVRDAFGGGRPFTDDDTVASPRRPA